MPEGPTIAVLPFTNLSDDPKQEYFSDGLTEDILTELSRARDLRVLARNTTFQYKGKAKTFPSWGASSACDMCSRAAFGTLATISALPRNSSTPTSCGFASCSGSDSRSGVGPFWPSKLHSLRTLSSLRT